MNMKKWLKLLQEYTFIQWVKLLQHYTFTQLFLVWVSIGVTFGIVYYLLSFFPQNALLFMGQPINHSLNDFLTIIYFSFITLTSTGYGDVVPLGISRLLVIFEIFLGLMVFGFLVSKVISARQEKIIDELYDLSFEEKVSKLRSSLYAYRANISRLIDRVKITRFYRRPDLLTELEANVDGLKTGISRVRVFLVSENKKSVSKVDDLTLNLLFNSLNLSVVTLIDVLELFNKKKYDWKQKHIIRDLLSIIDPMKSILSLYENRPLKDEIKSLLDTNYESLKKLKALIK